MNRTRTPCRLSPQRKHKAIAVEDCLCDPLEDRFKCFVCLSLLCNPVITSCCGQTLCAVCADRCGRRKGGRSCPHCNVKAMHVVPNRALADVVGQLKLRCRNAFAIEEGAVVVREGGCPFVCSLEDMPEHLELCEYAEQLVRCNNKGCHALLKLENVSRHEDVCNFRAVHCICGRSVPFLHSKRHEMKECDANIQPCKFEAFGYKAVREVFSKKHEELEVASSTASVSGELLHQVEEENQIMRRQVRRMKCTIKEMDEYIVELRQQREESRQYVDSLDHHVLSLEDQFEQQVSELREELLYAQELRSMYIREGYRIIHAVVRAWIYSRSSIRTRYALIITELRRGYARRKHMNIVSLVGILLLAGRLVQLALRKK